MTVSMTIIPVRIKTVPVVSFYMELPENGL